MFTELTIPLYLEKMASTSFPSPKGGSALAINGAMGAALTKMCCQVSAKRNPDESRYQAILEEADKSLNLFLKLADDDTIAVYEMLQTGKRANVPAKDCDAIQKGYQKASDSLFLIGEAAKALLILAQELKPLCASSCIVDLKIVEILAQSIKESIVHAIGDNYKMTEEKGCSL